MANEDLTQDPNYTTPGGAPLAALARNPHTNVDVVHGATGGGTPESTVVLQLVDYVPEHTIGGSTQRVLQTFDMTDTLLSGSSPLWNASGGLLPHPPYNEFGYLDDSTSWKWVGQLQTEAGKHYTVSSYLTRPQSTIKVLFGSEQRDLTSYYETMDFVGDGSLVEVGYLFEANTTDGYVVDFYVETQVGSTIVPASCTDFVRKVVDGIVTDCAADGVTPYVVQGQIFTHCPIQETDHEQNYCSCSAEFADLKQELSDIKVLVQQLLNNNPTQTQVDTGQPSLRLPAGTYTKAQILRRLNTEHYNAFVDTNAGLFASYGLNSIVLAPSSTFNLSVAGSTSQSYDYPVSLEAGGNEYLLQEVDDFTVVVPTGETLDVHMVVWLTGVAP